ncbi:RES family NAD+ phosphorylase [Streptomyces sp. XD-27]|uniref:RES family NAD+ phosphorylase n=1 Tax=Streptomyces sp. XD-27 TaxID=3062779 RepID=UPI0026F41CF2|nr:RES family NAD+ phosphorylase [Streptomyces sp. XD-27]WKX69539.1 RES family NAD+ phosphorylase [Streptomyces sp. XD-27]
MPDRFPPTAYRMTPRLCTLPAGTALWRCHSSKRPAEAFNPVAADSHFGGNRFDGTPEDPYPFLYAGSEPATALAEVLLRSLAFDTDSGIRLVPRAWVVGRSLTLLRTRVDLRLIQLLSEEDLAAVCQDSWLLEAEGAGYAQTRRWASELRAQVTEAQGMVWHSRRHRPRRAVVLFGDRCGQDPLKPDPGCGTTDLGAPAGSALANRLLAPLRAAVIPGKSR